MQEPADILIVDDMVENLRVLVRLLEAQGYHTRTASNGSLAQRAAKAATPDLILLDIMMPDVDGYEVCTALKADAALADVPVMFLSALGQTEDKIKAFMVGGVDYITKPFQIEEVLARVKTHLSLRNAQKQLEQANAELVREVAARVQAEEELQQQAAELQAHNEELDAFAQTVAHDLKNPLSFVMGHAELVEQDYAAWTDEQVRQSLRTIAQNSRRMTFIIDELLLLASVRRMEEIDIQPLEMQDIVTEGLARLTRLIEDHQPEIIIPVSWPEALGYGPWLQDVWANYVSNAIKYGGRPDEGILPRIELGFDEWTDEQMTNERMANGEAADTVRDSQFEHAHIRFWVRDNGKGLSADEQERMFTPFTRLDQVRAKGHGLGLSVVQRIVSKLGGQVGVESEKGQGSIFYFTLSGVDKP